MSYDFGRCIKVRISGSSHGDGVGVRVEGLPAGFQLDEGELLRFLSRRAPGRSSLTSSRREDDIPEFSSGTENWVLTGDELTAEIKNRGQRRSDYASIADTPRPSHADYTAFVKYGGKMDMSGGGPFSGRMTAPLCIAGGIALQILRARGIHIAAHLFKVGKAQDDGFPLHPSEDMMSALSEKELPVINDTAAAEIRSEIESAAEKGDSVGGVIECAVTGIPAGLGGPLFDGVESRIADIVFGIPGVKGLEFGAGFEVSGMMGSSCNDPFIIIDGAVETASNNSGGIQGGITNGMPVTFRVAFKPTPSISVEQDTISLSGMRPVRISVSGRHDPCIAVRAVPVVEAAAALAILDIFAEEGKLGDK